MQPDGFPKFTTTTDAQVSNFLSALQNHQKISNNLHRCLDEIAALPLLAQQTEAVVKLKKIFTGFQKSSYFSLEVNPHNDDLMLVGYSTDGRVIRRHALNFVLNWRKLLNQVSVDHDTYVGLRAKFQPEEK